ncbi:D-alanine--D-alanine ligase [Thermoleophilia bacterium SCSIO 60948]|nr:D-alanine--D-alanine ligase [Thermoleophilia bacterium SCSIO 60948]
MRVAVLAGGRSLERQVSLQSGARAVDALEALGHEVTTLDIDAGLVASLRSLEPDVAFIALHGPGGEDGTVQELLEILGVAHTGPSVAACARCMDKVGAKHLLRAAGIATPDSVSFTRTAFRELGAADALDELTDRLGLPLVVKPASQGSALGVGFAAEREAVPAALLSAFSYDERVLIERHVEGRELAVAILDGEPLEVVEIRPRDEDRFNYDARYEIGRTDYLCPAELTAQESEAVRSVAVASVEALAVEGFPRVDLILGEDGPQVLEIEAIPGLTDTSLVPMAAEARGISFEALCERIVAIATTTTR